MTMQDMLRQLEEIDKKYNGDDVILSTNMMLSFPQYTSASRMIMIGNQLKQCVVPLESEKPRVFTNYENMVGENSDFNILAEEANYTVDKIIKKFPKYDSTVSPYLMFLRNEDTGEYSVIHRTDVEDLPEKYGFQYNNSGIDALTEGDFVQKGSVLRRPTSFDEYGNWGFGKNVPFIYNIDDSTIEDAIVVSESLAEDFKSVNVLTTKIVLNENNFLINLYGDENNFKVIPNIGEDVKGNRLALKRTIYKNQRTFDMADVNTRRRLSTDLPYHVSGGGTVVDIDIYCNTPRDMIKETEFNQQILEYLDMSTEYWTNIKEYTQSLLDAGENVSLEIRALNKRSKELTDPNYEIRDENNSAFSYITMYVRTKRVTGLELGQKITGRHGNKGVISAIIPDHEMYHVVETGQTVHIILNTPGPIGRLNIFQLMEQAINFIGDRFMAKINSCETWEEKEHYFFTLIDIFNPIYREWLEKDYRECCKTEEDKKYYFDIMNKHGIHMHIKPYWEERSMYDCIKQCFEEYSDFVTPYTLAFYDTISERWVPVINKQIVGDMYIMKQKQSSEKGLIVRSTGSISRLSLPCKSDSAKKGFTLYPKQPIRYGEQEYANQLISLSAETIAKKAVYVRTSPVGRMEQGKQLFLYPLGVNDIEVTGNMTNRAVDALNCYMLIMGRLLVFEYDVLNLDESEPNAIKEHLFQNRVYYCTTEEIKDIVAHHYARLKIKNDENGYILIGTEADLEEFTDEVAAEIKEDLMSELD